MHATMGKFAALHHTSGGVLLVEERPAAKPEARPEARLAID